MQKQHRRRDRRPKIWHDANRKLSESERDAILSIFDGRDSDNDFALSYAIEQFKSKYCDETLVTSADRKRAAIDKWLDQEKRNATTNDRLLALARDYNILPRVTWKAFIRHVRGLIRSVLGPLTDSVMDPCAFSGGATTSRRRQESLPALKYAGRADVTEPAVKYLDLLRSRYALLGEYGIFNDPRVVEGAILFTVPKKTDIDRCACKEPDINMYLQKGVGDHIRGRLRKFGVNLNDQSVNRDWAQAASICNDLATLDLSSASDSISIEVVRLLLPTYWFEYLNDIRSQSVWVDGILHRTSMFSSMGNGFTFELESLIFWALMRSVSYFRGVPGVFSVYGDDLIIPSELFGYGSWVLKEFGFSLNDSKSFHDSPFRESCGGHYYNGVDVTPFYLKRAPIYLTDMIRVANQLRRWAFADPSRQYEYPWVFSVWRTLRDFVPKGLWGGSDYSLDTQLVSPHVPRYRLCRVTSERKVPDKYRYIETQNRIWNRRIDLPSWSSEPLDTFHKCRRRPASPGAVLCIDEFYEELISGSIPE